MSHVNLAQPRNEDRSVPGPLFWILLSLAALLGFAIAAFLALTKAGSILGWVATKALALDQSQVTWYITRASGWTGYLLLWLSTVWGLALPSKIFDRLIQRNVAYDFHEFLSLLALLFTGVHIAILAFDQYMPFSVVQIVLPFLSAYRPVWVAIGGLALYLMLLVTVTFYLRGRIGVKNFRLIHLLSLVAFVGAALHGLMSGSDSALPAAQLLYAGTFLSVVFLTTYWLVLNLQQKTSPKPLSQKAR